MADRVLRGSRLGAVSYETDRDHDLEIALHLGLGAARPHDHTRALGQGVAQSIGRGQLG